MREAACVADASRHRRAACARTSRGTSSPTSLERRRPRARRDASFISTAALLVKVMARISAGETPRSRTRCAMRYVSTRVLPEPAPASTSKGPSTLVAASRCAGLRSSRSGVIGHSVYSRGGSDARRATRRNYSTNLIIENESLVFLRHSSCTTSRSPCECWMLPQLLTYRKLADLARSKAGGVRRTAVRTEPADALVGHVDPHHGPASPSTGCAHAEEGANIATCYLVLHVGRSSCRENGSVQRPWGDAGCRWLDGHRATDRLGYRLQFDDKFA